MTPTIKVTFNLDDKTATVEDLFDYSTIIFDTAYGNVIARLGNTIVHTNTNFDSSADIVVGTNSSVTFDLLTDPSGNVIPGSYSFEYSVKVNGEVIVSSATVDPPVGSPFTGIDLNPASQPTIDAIQDQLDLDGVCTIIFRNNVPTTLGSSTIIATASDSGITFDSVAIAAFATIASIRVTAVTTYVKTFTYSYNTCPTVTPNLCVSSDCYYSQLTAIDATAYPAYLTEITRTITIQYPRLANGTPVQETVTTNDSSKTIGPNIWTGNYTISLITEMLWSQTDGLYLEQTISAYQEQNVQCSNGLCDLVSCINSFRSVYMEALAQGSRDIQKLALQNQVILLYCNQIRIYIDCKDTSKVTELTTQLAAYMNTANPAIGGCSCGCTDVNTASYTEPTEIFPLFGPNYTLNLQNITDAGNTTTQNIISGGTITANSFIDANGPVKPYRIYVANLTQISTSAPTTSELEDSIGLSNSNFTYSSVGTYLITKTGNPFNLSNTVILLGSVPNGFAVHAFVSSATQITIQTISGGVAADGVLSGTPIEIRIYP